MNIAFIGGGNMATALLGGLLETGVAAPATVQVVEVDRARGEWLHQRFGIAVAAAPNAGLRVAEVVVLAVKPQQARDACVALRPYLEQPLLVSVAAGIRAADLARWLGTERVVRAMPNTPALVGKGVSGLAALAAVTETDRATAQRILRAVGRVVWLQQERQLDAVTALSGSGPAYVFYFIEALLDAGRELGLTEAQTRTLAVETFVGAAALAAASEEPIATLRAQVTSKGGTTAAALERLDRDDVRRKIVAAVHAAHARARELGEEFGQAR